MKIALWGAGNTLNKVIDDIDRSLHTIEFLIDSDIKKAGMHKMGLPIKHYKDVDLENIDVIILTTNFTAEVRNTIKTEFPSLSIPVFEDTEHFLAYEYVNISHKEILKNPLFSILKDSNFSYDTDKRLQYLEIYDRYFSKFRGTDVVFLEIGVYHGGSVQLWKEYFGEKSKIIGIDINEDCLKFKDEQIEIEIGSQESIYFWDYIKEKYPRIDIILDDGGHTMKQQITTLEQMFPHLSVNGIYMCEDIFTSYWTLWGGDWGKKATFIEYLKELIDHVQTKFAPDTKWASVESFYNKSLANNIKSICFYQGIAVIEKDIVTKKIDNMLLGYDYEEKHVRM